MRGFFFIELVIMLGLLWGVWRLLKADAVKINKKVNDELNEKEQIDEKK